MRATGRAKPTLRKESLSEYYSEHAKKTYPEVVLVVEDIHHIFFHLTALSKVINVASGYPLESQANISKKSIADDSDVVSHWFEHDVQAMLDKKFERISGSEPDNPSDNLSWYAMLCGVIISLIHQFILSWNSESDQLFWLGWLTEGKYLS